MGRLVVLEHVADSEPPHYDWLIDPLATPPRSPDPDERRLIAFRSVEPPPIDLYRGKTQDDRASSAQPHLFPATGRVYTLTPNTLHRALYLEYEGPIPPKTPGGPPRGTVRRLLTRGAVVSGSVDSGRITLTLPDDVGDADRCHATAGRSLTLEFSKRPGGTWAATVQWRNTPSG
jgi:hypothetical protein